MKDTKNENSTKIIERLSQFVEFKHDNFNKLSLNIGVSNSYFSKMVRNNGSIGSELLSKIVKFYDDLNIHWLITGEGDMLKSSTNVSQINPLAQPSSHAPVPTDQTPGTECKLCKEKDERIADLKDMNAGYKHIIESQQSVIHSLQLHIDDLQQLHFDDEEDIKSQAG